jgi:signal transduction histidine kinase
VLVTTDAWQPWRMVAGLAVIIWAFVEFPDYPAGSAVLVSVALAAAAAGWLGWAVTYNRAQSTLRTFLFCWMGLSGSVLLYFDPSLTVCWFAFWACVEAGAALPRRAGLALAGTSCAILLAGRLARHADLLGTLMAVDVIGYFLGLFRRQWGLAATTAERNRIAGELHDILGHSLTALSLQVETAAAALEGGGDVPRALRHLARAAELSRGAQEEAVAAVTTLRDGAVGLRELTEQLIASSGVTARLTVHGTERPLSAIAGMAVYRLVQESLTNAGKHAPGAEAAVTFDYRADSLAVTVINSAGRDTDRTVGVGQGLRGMRERIAQTGGTVSAGPTADGWRVEARVPA